MGSKQSYNITCGFFYNPFKCKLIRYDAILKKNYGNFYGVIYHETIVCKKLVMNTVHVSACV